MKIRQEQKYLLYLIDCILNGNSPEMPTSQFDWEWFARYAEKQQFEQILYTVFEEKNPGFADETWMHLQQRYGLSITRDAEFEVIAGEIFELFAQNQIQHIPLKGEELKKYYPLPEIRSSFDIDILVHDEDMKKAQEALVDAGFKAEDLIGPVHYTFSRDKFHIELHRALMPESSQGYEFSQRVWEYSKQKTGYTYVMDNEFFYIYLLEHLRKHICTGGAGLKLITDFYVINKKMPIDEIKLNSFLKEANLTVLNGYVKLLISKWFNNEKTDNIDVLLLEQLILNTSAYGDYSVCIKMKYFDVPGMTSTTKSFFKHAFPNLKYMAIRFPCLKKYPCLLPITWIIRAIIRPKRKAKQYMNAIKTFTDDEADTIKSFIANISE